MNFLNLVSQVQFLQGVPTFLPVFGFLFSVLMPQLSRTLRLGEKAGMSVILLLSAAIFLYCHKK